MTGSSVVIWRTLNANARYTVQNACVYICYRPWLQETNSEGKCSLRFSFVSIYYCENAYFKVTFSSPGNTYTIVKRLFHSYIQ